MKKLFLLPFVIFMIGGIYFTAYGLLHLSWPSALPWSGSGAFLRFIASLLSTLCLIMFISWRTKISGYSTGALLILILSLFTGNLWPLLVVLWIFLSSFLLGRIILRFMNEDEGADDPILQILVGLGFYGTVVGLFAHFPISYPSTYYLLLLFPIFLKYRECTNIFKVIIEYVFRKKKPKLVSSFMDCTITAVGLIYILVSFMPELGFDALAMHLFIPAQLYSKHKWSFDAVTYVWATTPMLGDWIFSIPYMISGEFGSRLILVGFIFIVAGLIRKFCLWAGGNHVGVRWSTLVFFSTPLTFALGSTLFIDVIWSAFLIAGFYAVYKFCFDSSSEGLSLYTASLFLGYAAASKAVTLTILPILVVILFLKYKVWFKLIYVKKILIAILIFILMGCSPYITAWVFTGNPVFPFFNAFFKSTYYPFVNFDSSAVFGRGVHWDTIYKTVFESGRYFEAGPGASGFQWLILLIPALFLLLISGKKKGLLILLTGIAILTFVFQSVSYLRYAFPAWALLAAAIGVAISTDARSTSVLSKIFALACVLVVVLNLLFFSAGSFYRDFSLKSIFDRSSDGSYIVSRLPIRKAVQIVNELNLSMRPIAVFGSPLGAGLKADALYPNWYNNRFQSAVASSKSDKDLANVLMGYGVDYIILEANWNGLGCCGNGAQMQKMLEDITINISDLGLISVRKLKEEFYFHNELLVNPDLMGNLGWSIATGVQYDKSNGAMIVTINSSATQAVSVNPGVKYRNSVVARCSQGPSIGRVQVNWLDKDGKFIDASIKTFECTHNWMEYSMDVISPKGARTGIVYVVGHSNVPLEYKRSSFKK